MPIYRSAGKMAFIEFAAALADEHAIAHELAQCAKSEVYHLLASDLFERIAIAHAKTESAFDKLKSFISST